MDSSVLKNEKRVASGSPELGIDALGRQIKAKRYVLGEKLKKQQVFCSYPRKLANVDGLLSLGKDLSHLDAKKLATLKGPNHWRTMKKSQEQTTNKQKRKTKAGGKGKAEPLRLQFNQAVLPELRLFEEVGVLEIIIYLLAYR
jgi:hypothetical protein